MDAKFQRRVQRYGWDAAASQYEPGWAPRLRAAQDRLLSVAGLAQGMQVLETACGSGLVTARIAEMVGQSGAVMATDLSQAMVDATTRMAAARGLAHVAAQRMDAEELDLPDAAFDSALCALGLMYVPDPARALAEMARVTRPGGRVAVTVWGERKHCGWAEIFPIVDARVASEVCPMFFGPGGRGVLLHIAGAAGLTGAKEWRDRVTLDWPDAASLLLAMIGGGPVALAAKRFSPNVRAEVEAEFLASVAGFSKPDGSYAIPGEFVTVAGTI
ncbi:MAG: dimethylmenaquinone methyltransferase [Alphaproteobacteria bacterium HGW-Alphaproteobacteria-6]|nr:MAG: dimethylmenaquinone methyltransferase [Alphaproteobacteria bacterium HGW-Alphaproteobacteria-6]